MLKFPDKTLLALSEAESDVSVFSLKDVIGTYVGIPSFSISLGFLSLMELSKKKWKRQYERSKKHRKIAFLTSCKWNSIEKKISKALIGCDANHVEFILVISEKANYVRLKESIITKEWNWMGYINTKWIEKIKIDEILNT